MEVEQLDALLASRQGKVCVICDQKKSRGIHLYTSFICTECEQELISTETSSPKYKYYLTKLKKVTTPEIFS